MDSQSGYRPEPPGDRFYVNDQDPDYLFILVTTSLSEKLKTFLIGAGIDCEIEHTQGEDQERQPLVRIKNASDVESAKVLLAEWEAKMKEKGEF